MSVRVRFAPSPTGYLHIGGARTALYNYLYAKAVGGTFVLRIEDTDLERSSSEFEKLQIADLEWLGIIHDEGPDKPNPLYAPYRQTERLDIYAKYALQLVDKGLAFYDFCTDEELEASRNKAQAEGRDPHYDGKWKNPENFQEAKDRIAKGEKAAIRFLVPKKSFTLQDKVKGEVTYPIGMVGDFVIMRATGMPVYNFCCVVDDMLMDITHVIRGEDHLSNTVRQLMVYEALGAKLPVFAHVSLLIGNDRQKLSKRHGATSVNLYRNEHYLPEAMNNYLCLLGWSHPTEMDIFTKEDLKNVFSLDRFSPSPAIYDLVKFKYVNGQHLRKMSNESLIKLIQEANPTDIFLKQSPHWQQMAIELLKNYADFITDFSKLAQELILFETIEKDEKLEEILKMETTPKIIEYVKSELDKISMPYISEEILNQWMDNIKNVMGIKGKPLFMGVRATLTGKDHGPDLKLLIPLTPIEAIKKRIASLGV
jgi:glutamyl-tRNA synthetase